MLLWPNPKWLTKIPDPMPGWWFGSFFSIYWEESSQVTNIFQRGRSTTIQQCCVSVKNDPFFHRDAEIWRWRPSCSWCGVESAALTSRRRAQAASWQVIDRWNLCVLKGGTSHLPQPVLDPYKLDSILGFSWHYFRVYEGPQEINQFRSFFLMFSHF